MDNQVTRAVAVVGLAGVALIHVLDAPGSFQDAPYKGWLYVLLIAGCIGTSGVLLRGSDRRAWTAAALLPLGAIVAFVISRTVGLPNGADDIGNWTEPLGLASLFVEGSLVALAGAVLTAPLPRGALGVRPGIRALSGMAQTKPGTAIGRRA